MLHAQCQNLQEKISIPTIDLIFLALSAYLRVLYVSSNEQVDGLTKEGKNAELNFRLKIKIK